MSWSFLVGTALAGNGSTPLTGPTTAINTTGAKLIIVGVIDYNVNVVGTMSDSASNSWSAADVLNSGGTGVGRAQIFSIKNPITSASHTFSYTPPGVAYAPVLVMAFSGGTSGALDQTNGSNSGTSTVTTLATGSITPTQSSELIIALLGDGNVAIGSPSINNGTLQEAVAGSSGNTFGAELAYYVQSTAAAINQTFTWTSAAEVVSVVASYKLPFTASAGGGGALLLLGNMIGWTPSLSGLLLPAGLAVGRKAGELIRSGAKISRRSLFGKE